MHSDLLPSLDFTENREGLYSCRRNDPGNWTGGRVGRGNLVGTMRGISAPEMAGWLGDPSRVTAAVMQGIDQTQYRQIAQSRYWNPLWCDRLPAGVDLMMFDYGFNAGVHGALTVLASIYGSLDRTDVMTEQLLSRVLDVPEIVVSRMIAGDFANDLQRYLGVPIDGVVGPITLTAIAKLRCEDLLTIYALACAQAAAYRQMPGFRIEGDGWLARLWARVEMARVWARENERAAS